ncbi:MAG TPA: choice-of-anchor tandem repeat GloVer-containing protein [Candidatus Sulfotelmatobacter sp.]|jgi:uncharacterized repeat protein (TIGR03803 family)|nr:choice-of-anchor tandem repeat GloVer-containing protein [Candidatus Sulfotelmatobacter sp.]
MLNNKVAAGWAATLMLCAVSASVNAFAQTETILHSFNQGVSPRAGSIPSAGLIFDGAGNLYGTTVEGGTGANLCFGGCGVAFELSPRSGGGWTEKVLHEFGNGEDGQYPFAGLVSDGTGHLYGTAVAGGSGICGCGIVFELIPKANGAWEENVLHTFSGGESDGADPETNLILDAAGNLYGTTTQGGPNSGTVFELQPQTDGRWAERILHGFGQQDSDGNVPSGPLVSDTSGNLYGTTENGGSVDCDCGTVFELSPAEGGKWAYKTIYVFGATSSDSSFPLGGLIVADGKLYGTAYRGGISNEGTVFELSRNADGTWAEEVLHSFGGTDGMWPVAGLTVDAAGNLYGTTEIGGAFGTSVNGYGTVFVLRPVSGGGWNEIVLHSFGQGLKDGRQPEANLVLDKTGNLYGTTSQGDPVNGGTVFEIEP